MSLRDLFSNLGFFQAFPTGPTDGTAGATNGNTIDLQGYGAATMLFGFTSYCSDGANGAGDYQIIYLQHGLASAAGVSAWSTVPASLLVHSVYGGYDSTDSVILFSYTSASEITGSTQASIIIRLGYKGDNLHRYLRWRHSNVGNASAIDAYGVAVLGEPANWPINTPV